MCSSDLPVDLQRMEVIKGAASALYGGQSLGGVINLVSKPPTGQKEILFNRRTLGVTDAATWLSHRFSKDAGISLLVAGTTQGAEDVDGDGWSDQARARRWSIRPRFNVVDERGRSLFLTMGYGYDDRLGGTFGSGRLPNGQPFAEALLSRRADVGGTASAPIGSARPSSAPPTTASSTATADRSRSGTSARRRTASARSTTRSPSWLRSIA